jgi:hypothetical protein
MTVRRKLHGHTVVVQLEKKEGINRMDRIDRIKEKQ